jgi:predicted Zn-dependent protease
MFKTKFSRFKNFSFLTLFTVAILAQSCKKSDLEPEETVSQEELQQLKTFVASTTGFPLTSVEYNSAKKYFIAGKDVLIGLSDARSRLKNTEISAPTVNDGNQRVYIYTATPNNAANISIYADNTVPAEWISALDLAIANWNSTYSHVVMKRVTAITTTTTTGRGKKKTTTTTTTPPAYNILVTTLYDASTSMVAQAFLPYSNGTVGNEVDINTYYNYLSSSYKTFTLTHELGHSIGFTHTDATYGNLIPGTPETDPNSVMNSFVLPWNGFTSYDVLAVNTIYPR